ncbi:MAG: cobaltochelatase subunit CobN [Spirulinaceae cyanobacterium]
MHRLAATPGGWNPDAEGVIFIEQTPAPIVFLTAADTDIQTLAAAVSHLPEDFPETRVANLLQLQQQLTIDTYGEDVLSAAKIIILRLLGGRGYWPYGLEVVKEIAEETGCALFVLPGDERPDPSLISHSTVSLAAVNQLWRYLTEGGVANFVNAWQFAADTCLGTNYHPSPPQTVPRLGFYDYKSQQNNDFGKVGIIFYRAHYLAGNIAPIDALCEALIERNLVPVPMFISSLSDPGIQEELLNYFQGQVQLILNTASFSIAKLNESEKNTFWQELNVPVLQVILSGGTKEQWASSWQGLTPRDVAMNVALPEVDGKIITRAISFKSVQTWYEKLETDVVIYEPVKDRVDFVADLARNWLKLKQTPITERKIALILANYPNKDGRLANGVGLDTPASCLEILQALQKEGYEVTDIPSNGDELISRLTSGVTNDPESKELRPCLQSLSLQEYQQYFATLPEKVQTEIRDRWQNIPSSNIPIPGIQLGNVFIGIQPSRGYDIDPSLNYHAPDLEPTPEYLAYYYWLKNNFGALAIIHVGKHGNLEWLPGKSVSLSSSCYPEITLGAMPHFYPFIVNDPGEGSQAKRRSQGVIVDHLTPPMTRAELYGNLHKVEALVDEYYEAQTLDPSRLKIISDRLLELIIKENLHQDLGLSAEAINNSSGEITTSIDGYLCELKEAQIKDGLHILGQCPQGRQLRDLIVAIARSPNQERIGLTCALAEDLGWDFNPLTANPTDSFLGEEFYNLGDAIESLEEKAASLVEKFLSPLPSLVNKYQSKHLNQEINWIQNYLLPKLQQTPQEITNLLRGLAGQYIPSGAAGAPTRGRADVLPTGRNFYSVDIRAIPTETAWDVGRKAAEVVVERYTQENGEYPQTLAISLWGTSTMRTGGDDIAQALALLGVQPVWDGASRRVVDFEILPVSGLGRPRVDVTLRISGFFRDGFPNLIDLFYNAVNAVASLDEPPEDNPLASKARQEEELWQKAGLEKQQAKERSRHRIFGSKPGAYGAGLQGLIEGQNWTSDEDLARAYINWSSYAYGVGGKGKAAPEAFAKRLEQLQIVLHNQDNREHDLLDSDDYYQFQGGLTAAVRAVTGKNPQTYFGDNSIPTNPKVRQLTEEIARVYRSRVVNPKWIAGVMRHGYKGAFEMAATVDYLFAYDATARCVADYMYQGVAEAYIFDEEVQKFIEDKNPWALRDMAERLLEAQQRGLWQEVTEETINELKAIVNQAEGEIEVANG